MRAAVRVAGLILLFFACLLPHLISKTILGRSLWPPRFLAAAAWIVGARVRIAGGPIRPHSLLLANHVSWLDILILGGATGCAFVSKDNLGHGLIHWLADQNQTLYIHRARRSATADQANAIATRLELPQPLALFPEGTTGPGDHLLPFRSSLLAAVAPAPRLVDVRPVALDYGSAALVVGWYNESGKDNILRVLGRKGTLPTIVHILPALARSDDRKLLAHHAREQIATTLTASSSARTGL